MADVANTDDVIDSRDVIARIEELEELCAEDDTLDEKANNPVIGEDEREELTALKALAEEAEGSPGWQYGETLIRDSYFKEYARQLAVDCGDINHNTAWPATCIDWGRAARELQMAYTSVEFNSIDYWIRS